MNLQEIQNHVKEIGDALLLCVESKKRIPSLILIYTAIDMISSLTRPVQSEETNGAIFKAWVSKYLVPEIEVDVKADDIWGARCGVLHTNQPDSQKSREGKARTLQYYQGPKEHIDLLQDKIDPNREKMIVLNIDQLAQAYLSAIVAYYKDVNANAELRERMKHHGQKVFVRSTFDYIQSS